MQFLVFVIVCIAEIWTNVFGLSMVVIGSRIVIKYGLTHMNLLSIGTTSPFVLGDFMPISMIMISLKISRRAPFLIFGGLSGIFGVFRPIKGLSDLKIVLLLILSMFQER